jgi:cell division protein FtsW
MSKNAPKIRHGAPLDYWLLGFTLILASLGLIMVLSASGIMAERFYHDKYLFFKKQGLFMVLGVIGMYAVSKMPRAFFYSMIYPMVIGCGIALAFTLTPMGLSVNGARRWLRLGVMSIQPMEFVKPALVMYLAYFFSRKQEMVKTFSVGFLPPMAVTGAFCLLLALQPDFGGAVVLALLLLAMCLVGGTRITYLVLSVGFAAVTGWMMIVQSPYRFKRWTAFLDPFKTAREEGYQLVQSLYAFGSGSLFGTGIGAGRQKLFFLPEAHNDFIMAVVGEELGFIGMSAVMLLVALILLRAFLIAFRQDDLQDRFTGYGMALVLATSFVLNIAVVLGCVPPKGVPMPFMSYGGSNLLGSFFCIGMLLNLSRGVSK